MFALAVALDIPIWDALAHSRRLDLADVDIDGTWVPSAHRDDARRAVMAGDIIAFREAAERQLTFLSAIKRRFAA